MSSSPSFENPNLVNLNEPPPANPSPSPLVTQTVEKPSDPLSDQSKTSEKESRENEVQESQEGEEEECGFCLFMKGGGCKEVFVAWEKCVEDAEKNKDDIVDKCYEVTGKLKQCMDAHADYYEPVLRAEKVMEEEAARELDREIQAKDSDQEAARELDREIQAKDSDQEHAKVVKQEEN